jgi:hypothetical protein
VSEIARKIMAILVGLGKVAVSANKMGMIGAF